MKNHNMVWCCLYFKLSKFAFFMNLTIYIHRPWLPIGLLLRPFMLMDAIWGWRGQDSYITTSQDVQYIISYRLAEYLYNTFNTNCKNSQHSRQERVQPQPSQWVKSINRFQQLRCQNCQDHKTFKVLIWQQLLTITSSNQSWETENPLRVKLHCIGLFSIQVKMSKTPKY